MNACKNATKSSIAPMNKVKGTEINAPTVDPPMLFPASPNIKIKLTKLMITICPAVMFAKSRNNNVNGFKKTPRISTGVKIRIFNTDGTPGIHKICSQ